MNIKNMGLGLSGANPSRVAPPNPTAPELVFTDGYSTRF
jgi:hypothetical protein